MRGDSVEVAFSGEIRHASRDDIFRVVWDVAGSYERHRVVPAGESAVMVRYSAPPPMWWFFVSFWALLVGNREDSFVVNTRATPGGTHVDIIGTGVSQVVDELGDALDALSAGGSR